MSTTRIEALQRMVDRRPDDPRARFGLAVEHLQAGSLEEGVQALRIYLSLADDQGNAWGRLGDALMALGLLDEAREAYRTGIEAALRHGHPTMAETLTETLEGL
jgi:Flp pilus assembly protein TadD